MQSAFVDQDGMENIASLRCLTAQAMGAHFEMAGT